MEINGRRYDNGEAVQLELRGGKILRIRGGASPAAGSELPWIAPGFVDLQVNGYGGREFTDPDLQPEHVLEISRGLDATGVTQYLATITTQSFERIDHSFRTIAAACETSSEVSRRIFGIHLEGPYISPHDGPRGAHPKPHCRPPDLAEFHRLQQASGGRIRLITLSPEYDEAPDFIRAVASEGVLVSIGHTAATSAQIARACDAGARMSTHLGNGAHAILPRHPNYLWDQLADDRLTASLIADGHHLPAAVVKSMVRAKGVERCVLVSDLTGLAGMPPGHYSTGLGEVEVLEDGRLVVAGQRQFLAGAARPIGDGIVHLMSDAGLSRAAAVELASLRPAALIGLPVEKLEAGSQANLVLFDLIGGEGIGCRGLKVRATLNQGEVVFGSMA